MNKKILLVTDTWLPQVNGVVTSLQKIIPELEAQGYQTALVHPGLSKTIPMPFYAELRFSVFPARLIREAFKREKPAYVHIVNEGPLGVAARAYCLRHKIPFTTSFHTHFPLYIPFYAPLVGKPVGKVAYRYLRWFHNASQATLVCSRTLQEDLAEHGFKHLAIWPLGVDTDRFKRNEKAEQRFKGPVFVYFGRVSEEKGLEEFFKSRLPGTKLVIGDGPSRKKLEKKYGKEAVFVGYKKGKELVDLLSISDVMVLPSLTETFGLVVVEALSCGLPVAAHDVMGPRDIVTHGVDGFLDEDLEKAAKASLGLSRGKAREKALTFSWKNSAKILIKHLVSISKA